MEDKEKSQAIDMKEVELKVNAFHYDKDKAVTQAIKRGYFNSLCPSLEEKTAFYKMYKEEHPEDKETLEMIEAEIKRQREKYPKDLGEMAEALVEDMSALAARAGAQMIENMAKRPQTQSKQQESVRHVAMSDNVYFDNNKKTVKPNKEKREEKPKRKFSFFGLFGRNKNSAKVEKVGLESTTAERQAMQKDATDDVRLEKYNENVKQRAMQNASKSAPERSNVSVMSR